MPFVLDCSMTMAWVFADEASESTDVVRDSLEHDHAVVPSQWTAEVGNVLLVATRRGRITRRDRRRIAGNLAALPIRIEPESLSRVLESVVPLAEDTQLSVYDGLYLEIAIRRKLPLATLDRSLGAAARARGVSVL